MTANRFRIGVTFSLWLLTLMVAWPAGANEPIDWQRAQELRRREQQGETLNEQDRAYLDRAKQQLRQKAKATQAAPARETTGQVPVTEMGDRLYKEQTGGLYGQGQNVAPASHRQAAREQTALMCPRDAQGNPAEAGRIVLMPPTLKTVEELAAHRTTEALFKAVSGRAIPPILPQPFTPGGEFGVKLPFDPEYTIDAFKLPPRPGETCRIVTCKGIWKTATA